MVVVSQEPGAPTMRAQQEARQAELERGVQSDPLVQAVLKRFPGAKVVGVTQHVADAPEAGEAVPEMPPPEEEE
jgi:DNA polymerase-3 subunit gamma/tau